MMKWLFLDLDSYFASCEQQARPDLRGKPIGVLATMVESTSCLAASVQAKKFGVKTGTSVLEARARCPEITFVLSRPDLYTLYHKAIAETINTCIPIEAVMSIDEMICELKGSQREIPNALKLAHLIKSRLRERVGEILTCSIGLATNRFLAKVCCEMNKPNGITFLRKEELPAALYGLKLEDFPGIGPRMAKRLAAHGITSTQALCQLSAAEMGKIWGGIVGRRFHDWLRGEDTTLAPTTHRSLGHQHVLEPEFRTSEGAWYVAKKLLTKAAVRLRKEGSFAKRLYVYVSFMGDLFWEKEARLGETQDTLVAISALRELWKELPKATPFMVSVTFRDLVPQNRHQLSLLVNPNRENLGSAMDRINTKFGRGALSLGTDERSAKISTRIPFQRIPDLEEF